MKVSSYRCICPVCREHFTAFMHEREKFDRDEVDPSQRALLCVCCERRFITQMFLMIRLEGRPNGGLPIDGVPVPAVQPKAPLAGEPRSSSATDADDAACVPGGVSGVSDSDSDPEIPRSVFSDLEPLAKDRWGETVLPSDPIGEDGVI